MTAILKRLKKDEKGFTLIELLAVIVILGIIAAIAIPLIGNVLSNNKAKSDFQTARQIYDAARLYITNEKEGVFTSSTGTGISATVVGAAGSDTLQGKGYLDQSLSLPSSKKTLTAGTVQFTTTGQLLYVSINDSSGLKYYKGSEVMKGEGSPIDTAPTSP